MRSTFALIYAAIFAIPLFAAEPRVEFFEKKIRPVLIEHCERCHSAAADENNKLRGGLFVDSKKGLLDGGDTGPAIIPGEPTKSLLLESLRYDGEVRMPPKGKLPDAVIADFEKWIADGAFDPRGATGKPTKQVGLSIAEGKKFWSYRPVADPKPPTVKNPAWTAPIDRFILAKLEAAGLEPAPTADKRTLIHRLSQDLTGLPPTIEEVDAFLADESPDAYEKLVDRLLDSPRFGERWGRHWLDVARFAESVTLRGLVFKEAWRYRDYVIDSYNRDVPFDRFITEQLAGDLLPADTLSEKRRQRIATTFLILGNMNLEDQDKKNLRMDLIDEQLDVISKGFLGQTVTCARCHDHKFDPIPTADYYALAGILGNVKGLENANVSRWVEVPLPLDPKDEAAYEKHDAEIARVRAEIKKLKTAVTAKAEKTGKALTLAEVPGIVIDGIAAKKVGEWKLSQLSGTYIGAGYVHDLNEGKGEKSLSFEPVLPATGRYEVRLAYASGTSRSAAVPVTVFSADGEKELTINMKVAPSLDGRFVSLGTFRFEKDGQSYVTISNEGTTGHVTADAVTFIPENASRERDPASRDRERPESKKPLVAHAPGSLKDLEAELKKLQQSAPKRPMTMSVIEEPTITEGTILIRGVVHNEGDSVPRGVLQVATVGESPNFPKDESGRKELAEWIASADNPLTARVYANRVWHWLMGSGLVRTVDNFGTTGELPSHPELLDHLATQLIRDGWSTKRLIRQVVLSQTYRQSSQIRNSELGIRNDNPQSEIRNPKSNDPENRLFGHANPKRLEAEQIRDKILAVSGELDLTLGGPTFPEKLASDYGYQAETDRRSVYLPVFRGSMPEMLAVFDAADPSLVTGKRNTSTVAPQALYLLNNPFVVEQAKVAATRLLEREGDRIALAYRLTLGREPTDRERSLTSRFLETQSEPAEAWAAIVQALFASAEFRTVR